MNKIDKIEDALCACHLAIYKATKKIDTALDARTNTMVRRFTVLWNDNLKVMDKKIAEKFTGTGKVQTINKSWSKKMVNDLFHNFSNPLKSKLEKDIDFMYKLHKKDYVVTRKLKPVEKAKIEIIPTFTDADTEVSVAIANQQLIASNAYYKRNLSKEVTQIVDAAYKQGLNDKQTGELLRSELGKKLSLSKEIIDTKVKPEGYNGSSESYFKGLGETTQNRARNYSSLRALDDAAFTEYRIFNARPVADICIMMVGRTFTVKQGLDNMNKVLNSKNIDELKDNAAWRKDLKDFNIKGREKLNDSKTAAALSDAGMGLPPYHTKCKTIIEPV